MSAHELDVYRRVAGGQLVFGIATGSVRLELIAPDDAEVELVSWIIARARDLLITAVSTSEDVKVGDTVPLGRTGGRAGLVLAARYTSGAGS